MNVGYSCASAAALAAEKWPISCLEARAAGYLRPGPPLSPRAQNTIARAEQNSEPFSIVHLGHFPRSQIRAGGNCALRAPAELEGPKTPVIRYFDRLRPL